MNIILSRWQQGVLLLFQYRDAYLCRTVEGEEKKNAYWSFFFPLFFSSEHDKSQFEAPVNLTTLSRFSRSNWFHSFSLSLFIMNDQFDPSLGSFQQRRLHPFFGKLFTRQRTFNWPQRCIESCTVRGTLYLAGSLVVINRPWGVGLLVT